jgi:hypothetical protein
MDTAVVYFSNQFGGKAALEQHERQLARKKSSQPALGSLWSTFDALPRPIPMRLRPIKASLTYTRFHGIASRRNLLLNLVQRRVQQQSNLPRDTPRCRRVAIHGPVDPLSVKRIAFVEMACYSP